MTGEAQAPESVVARLRPHGRAMFWPSLALIVIFGFGGYYLGSFDEGWQNVTALVVAIALVLLLWFIPLLAWLGRNYTITTRRIVLRSGFLVRSRQELLHSRGYDVVVRKNSLQSMFRSGDIRINTGLDRPVVLRDVPHVDLVQAALTDLMENSQNLISTHRQQQASRPTDETTAWGSR